MLSTYLGQPFGIDGPFAVLARGVHHRDNVLDRGAHRQAAAAGQDETFRAVPGIAQALLGFGDNLLTRAADVTLKERRRLVLMVRETPFNLAHLRNMTAVTEMGGIVFPPLPAFYLKQDSVQALIDESVERVLQLCGVAGAAPQSWEGLRSRPA